jgi:hypothetical protein
MINELYLILIYFGIFFCSSICGGVLVYMGMYLGRQSFMIKTPKQYNPGPMTDIEGDYIGDELADGIEPEEDQRVSTFNRKY